MERLSDYIQQRNLDCNTDDYYDKNGPFFKKIEKEEKIEIDHFTYEQEYSQIKNLSLYSRDGVLTDTPYLTFGEFIDKLKSNSQVAYLDIKEDMRNKKERKNDWLKMVRICYDIAKEKDALQHIVVKTIYPFDDIVTEKKLDYGLTQDEALQILYMPIKQPDDPNAKEEVLKKSLSKARKLISGWGSIKLLNGKNLDMRMLLAGFEINFKTEKDVCFNKYKTVNNQELNTLQYIDKVYKLRAAVYSEEPVGPKGNANRYAQWDIKDLDNDFRGDHLWLIDKMLFPKNDGYMISPSIRPIITTDRWDVWDQLVYIYKLSCGSTPHVLKQSLNSNVVSTDNNTIALENSEIHARYESGLIIISGLIESDMGSHVALYDLQGRLIFQDKVDVNPQMIISKNLQTGIFIMRISGNRHVSKKLIVNKLK